MANTERKQFLDVLRIFSILAVVTLHIFAKEFWHLSADSTAWNIINIILGSTRWCVPVFVMISGSLYLDPKKEVTSKKLAKGILRIAVAFIFWSAVYSLINGDGLKNTLFQFINGHYHMWFLFMIVGLYLLVPFLRKITENEKLLNYFLVLSFIFTFLLPTLCKIAMFNTVFAGVFDNTKFFFTLGYVPYFVLGYKLSVVKIKKQYNFLIYFLGAVGLAATILLTRYFFITNRKTEQFYDYLSINTLFVSIAVFAAVRSIVNSIKIPEKLDRVMTFLSNATFGVYLSHALFIDVFYNIFITARIPYIVVVLAIWFLSVICSFATSVALSKIPVLGKYIT